MADFLFLEQKLGYSFGNQALLRQALTHPSLGGRHNQRLEFLGDAVLELCVSEKIFAMHPEMQEGAMTQLRQKLVREEKLARCAREIGLVHEVVPEGGLAAAGEEVLRAILQGAPGAHRPASKAEARTRERSDGRAARMISVPGMAGDPPFYNLYLACGQYSSQGRRSAEKTSASSRQAESTVSGLPWETSVR